MSNNQIGGVYLEDWYVTMVKLLATLRRFVRDLQLIGLIIIIGSIYLKIVGSITGKSLVSMVACT